MILLVRFNHETNASAKCTPKAHGDICRGWIEGRKGVRGGVDPGRATRQGTEGSSSARGETQDEGNIARGSTSPRPYRWPLYASGGSEIIGGRS